MVLLSFSRRNKEKQPRILWRSCRDQVLSWESSLTAFGKDCLTVMSHYFIKSVEKSLQIVKPNPHDHTSTTMFNSCHDIVCHSLFRYNFSKLQSSCRFLFAQSPHHHSLTTMFFFSFRDGSNTVGASQTQFATFQTSSASH